MAKFAVSYISFFDNDLKIEVVEADTAKAAVMISFEGDIAHVFDYVDNYPSCTELEAAKRNAFDTDMMFEVIEI